MSLMGSDMSRETGPGSGDRSCGSTAAQIRQKARKRELTQECFLGLLYPQRCRCRDHRRSQVQKSPWPALG